MLIFGTPLHPKLVHFPVALLVSALFLGFLNLWTKRESFYKVAMIVYIMAAFSAPAAALSGWCEASRLHLKHPVLWAHRNFAFALTAFVLLSLPLLWMLRGNPQRQKMIFLWICCIAVVLVTAAAYFGGAMVFEYGIGVSL